MLKKFILLLFAALLIFSSTGVFARADTLAVRTPFYSDIYHDSEIVTMYQFSIIQEGAL